MTAPTPAFAQAIADMNASMVPMLANVQVTIGGVAVTGIFDNAATYAVQGQIGYEQTAPTLTLLTANVPSPAVGAQVTVGAQNFTVYAHEPDGTGLSRLLLERRA
jgi:hypothetical protein